MPTLIYAPAVRVVIATRREGVIDVSADLVRGNLTITENEVGNFSFSLTNQRRKYDGVFSPNDRITVQLKRLGPNFLQSFSGYLNDVPFLSLYPRTIDLAASCTLKRFQYQLWDSGAIESINLLNQVPGDASDGAGIERNRIMELVTKVGGWPAGNIHVGMIPSDWFSTLQPLEEEVATALGVAVNGARENLGGLAILAGLNPATHGTTTTPTAGVASVPEGAGVIPPSGKVKLSNFLGDNVIEMRWGYKVLSVTSEAASWLSPEKEQAAIQWWSTQKIMVVNPKNNRAVICLAGQWGPWGAEKGDAMGLNQNTLGLLQAAAGDSLEARLVDAALPLGQYGYTAPGAGEAKSDWSIPPGTAPRTHTDFAWHPNGNGYIPLDQLVQVTTPAGAKLMLHPVAAASYCAMRDAALRDGIKINPTDAYRDHASEVRVKAEKGDWAAAVGTSIHGWAMAMDMGAGSNTFGGDVHKWLVANGGRYGWVNPPWAKDGKGIDEPWHWEFWGGLKYVKTEYAALPRTVSGVDPNYQPGAAAPTATAPTGSNGVEFAVDSKGQLVNYSLWYPEPDTESEILVGERALMNDEPLLGFIQMLCNSSMRSFMSAPNGDFISWFPDYFGHFGIAGRMSVQDIELQGDGFTVTWSDSHIVTHQFVMGAMHSFTSSQFPGGVVEGIQKVITSGIVSIDFPKVLGALLNIGKNDPRFQEWIDKDAIYKRYGARKDFQTISTIVGAQAEFWCACYLFMKKWAQQFSTRAYMTFMPEVYPGMIVEFPSQKVQMYCSSVTHSFDFAGGGFQTSAVLIAPSAMDGSGLPFPRGGADPGPTSTAAVGK